MNRLSVTTDRGSQWKYSLLILMVSNNKPNIINLTRDSDTELHVDFTKEMLPVNGRYIMQFEYTDGNVVGHTDKFDAFVNDVINTEDTWVDIPSEFEQLRQEIMQNAIIAQNAANEAKKISQEIKVESDKAVQAAKDAQQYAQQAQQAVDLAQEAQRLAQEAKNQAVLSATEAEQSAIQANQSKTEAAESATQANQAKTEAKESATQASQSATQANLSKDEAKKAQLASEKARDESQAILEQIQSIKVEVDGIVAQINDARDKALQAIETNKNSAVESVNNAGTNNVANVNQAGATQVKAVNDTGVEQVQAVTNEGNKQVGLVTSEGTKQVQAVTTEGTNQLQSIRNEGSKQVQSITTEGTTQVKNVSDEGGKQVQAVTAQGETQTNLVVAEGTKQVGLVNTAGQEQVKAVNDAGAIQTANAKEQADRAKTEADRAEKAAEDAKTAAERAETMIDDNAVKSDKTWSSKNIVDMLCPPINERGNPVVCTPVAGYPLGITASWEPTQEGAGDPSPENIRPITGRENVTVERCGINILNDADFRNYGNWKTEYPGTDDGNKGVIIATVPGTYTVNVEPVSDTKFPVYLYLIIANENAEIDRTYITTDKILEKQHTKTISHGEYLYIQMGQTLTEEFFKNQVNVIKNIGVYINTYAPASYTPYIGQTNTITLPKTVYGGEVDVVTGDGNETWRHYELTADMPWGYQENNRTISADISENDWGVYATGKCSHYTYRYDFVAGDIFVAFHKITLGRGESTKWTVDTWKTYLTEQASNGTPVQIAIKLGENQYVPLTATGADPIDGIAGTNTILTDADSVTVTGRADPTAHYGKKIAELSAAIVAR